MTSERIAYKRLSTLLASIFFFSGFASLIYQVVWQRLLTLHYGVGSISTILIVSVYMLGLGIGALLGGLIAERAANKIIVYFLVELLLGLFGLVSLPFMNLLGAYTAGSPYIISLCCMFLFLCLPTLLMGITLPLLTKIFNAIVQDFLHSISFLYFINTLGAATGALCASYVIISFFGLDTGIYCAVAINFILAALIFLAGYDRVESQRKEPRDISSHVSGSSLGMFAYALVFITGFIAIGYEIVCFRVIGVLVKNSSYAFSSILSVYLFGIALGSFSMDKYLRQQKFIARLNLFFLLQFLIGIYVLAVFIGYYYLTIHTSFNTLTRISFSTDLHPSFALSFHSLNAFLKSFYALLDVFFWSTLFVLVPTMIMGASFPLISSLALSRESTEGKTVGTIYFFNITGNVLGGVLTGFILLPWLGTEVTVLLFSIIGVLLGVFVTKIADFSIPFSQRAGFVLLISLLYL